jgi:manganese catalase
VAAVFNGPHPETGEELTIAEEPHPEGAAAHDLSPQPDVFAPGYAPEEIVEIAQKLRKKGGLPDKPTGEVSEESANLVDQLVGQVKS